MFTFNHWNYAKVIEAINPAIKLTPYFINCFKSTIFIDQITKICDAFVLSILSSELNHIMISPCKDSVVLDFNSKKYFSKSLQNLFLIGTFSIFSGFKLQLNMKLFSNIGNQSWVKLFQELSKEPSNYLQPGKQWKALFAPPVPNQNN